jgi:hypothetical protein
MCYKFDFQFLISFFIKIINVKILFNFEKESYTFDKEKIH